MQTVENLPSASRKPSEEKEEIILCHVCLKKNEKVKKRADMYCYECDNVFCDHHAGVSDDTFDNRKIHGRAFVKSIRMSEQNVGHDN